MSAFVKAVQTRRRRARTGSGRGQGLFVGSALTPLMLYMMFWILLPMIWAVLLAFFGLVCLDCYLRKRQGLA